jgi:hypothetical protein
MLFLSKKCITACLSLLLILCLITACQPDATNDLAAETNTSIINSRFDGVDQRLWTYFERFEREGKARGIDVDLVTARITGVIEQLEGEHIAGQCTTYGGARPNHIVMDLDFWNNSSDLFKEFIIFHELGHCFLDRDHREDAHADGRCVSLMRSGNGSCRDNYTTISRNNYLNELFAPDSVD